MASPFDELYRRVSAVIPDNTAVILLADSEARLIGKLRGMEGAAIGRMLRAARMVVEGQVEQILLVARREAGEAGVREIQAGLDDPSVQGIFQGYKDHRPEPGGD